MKRKRMLAIMIATVMLGTTMLMGCGKQAEASNKNNDEIIVWHQFEGGVEDNLKKSFDELNKDGKIKVKLVKQTDLANKITLVGQSEGDAPDIILGPNDWAGRYSIMGIIEPISKYVDPKVLDNRINSTVDAVTYKNEVYAIPMTYECLVFMYNKKLLDKAPQNTDELLKLMKDKKQGDSWGFLANAGDAYHSIPWIYGSNGMVIDKEGKPKLNTAEVEDGVKLIKEMKEYLPKNMEYNIMDGLFKEGKAASIANGSWAIKEYKENKNIDLGVELLPTITKTGKRAQPFLGVQAAFVTSKGKDNTNIKEALEEFASEKVAKAFVDSGYLVADKNIDLSNDPIAKKLSEQAEMATPMPACPEMASVWEPLANTLKTVLIEDNCDIKDLLEKAQKQAEEKIDSSK